jgi:hypothetical protein
MSKHQLLEHWLQLEIVQDIAKIIGFAQFYNMFIPQFKLFIALLCNLTKFEYTEPVTPHRTATAQDLFKNVKKAILSESCLQGFNYKRLIVLRSEFLSKGFSYVVCQPRNDNALTEAINAYRSGSDFSFMTKTSTAVLHPVSFSARRCHGSEVCIHSHLGEGFAGDWAMNKCRHMLFGQQFVWVIDCYAIKFILLYDGANPTILHLQMQLMGWDINIVHQNNHCITDANYWSRLGAALFFDPLFKTNLDLTCNS